MRCRI